MDENRELRIAIIGMVEGNGHPYSWSAIFNGYDADQMKYCPYPVIPQYLERQPKELLRIQGARITHIWTDRLEDAALVAQAAYIPHIVDHPEDVIGHVDAVIIATDIGSEHADRCRPFVDAGLPIFIDKPLVDSEADLRQFSRWIEEGARILSTSSMRYCKEFIPYRKSVHNLGKIRFASVTTPKSWERYGIHALESIYPILGSGFISARNTGTGERNIVHLKHNCGADVIIAAIADMYGAFGALQLCGTYGSATAMIQDTFYAFKSQLIAFVDFVRSGVFPFPFYETQELMKLVIAGIRSREEDGREVLLSEISTGSGVYRGTGQDGERR